MAVRVLIDTNVLLDYLFDREPYGEMDCLQMECAISYHADYIVTRNLLDFKNSIIPSLEPEQFYQMMHDGGKTN